MASLVPRKEKVLTDKLSILDKIAAAFNEKAGGKIIVGRIGINPEIAERLKIKYIPTVSSELNEIMSGGYPKRRCTIVAGLPDSGKTSRLLEDIGYNMKKDPNFTAGWLESESSLELNYISKTHGIDLNRFFYMEVTRSQSAENILDTVESVLGTGAVDIFVVNSLKCLIPETEKNRSLAEASVAEQARMNSRMTKKFTGVVAEYDVAFVIITHLSTTIGTMSKDPLIIAGGHAIAYWSALTLDMRKNSISEADPIKRDQGMKIGVTVKKNHCAPDKNPYVKCVYYAIFGEGTEQILTSLDKAIEQGHLQKRGAYIYWYESDNQTVRYQWLGKEKYRNFMKENPQVFEELMAKLEIKVDQLTNEEIDIIKAEEKEIEAAAIINKEEIEKQKKNVRKNNKVKQ